MTIFDAILALETIPTSKVNDNCVQDAQWRLREAISLAMHGRGVDDEAPCYVVESVENLASWF